MLVAHLQKTKNKNIQRNRKFKIYLSKPPSQKACFQYFIVYKYFKDLNRKAFTDKIIRDKTFNVAKDLKYDGYQKRSCFNS